MDNKTWDNIADYIYNISIKTIEDKTILEIDVPPGKFRPFIWQAKAKKLQHISELMVQAGRQMQGN